MIFCQHNYTSTKRTLISYTYNIALKFESVSVKDLGCTLTRILYYTTSIFNVFVVNHSNILDSSIVRLLDWNWLLHLKVLFCFIVFPILEYVVWVVGTYPSTVTSLNIIEILHKICFFVVPHINYNMYYAVPPHG